MRLSKSCGMLADSCGTRLQLVDQCPRDRKSPQLAPRGRAHPGQRTEAAREVAVARETECEPDLREVIVARCERLECRCDTQPRARRMDRDPRLCPEREREGAGDAGRQPD